MYSICCDLLNIYISFIHSSFSERAPFTHPIVRTLNHASYNAATLTWLILILPISQRGEKLKRFMETSSNNRIHHLSAICLSSLLFCSASPHHFILPFMAPRPRVERGFRCGSGALQTKAKRVRVKLLWPHLFISSCLWLEHCLRPFSDSVLFSLTNRKAWRRKAKVPAATFRVASGVTDRPVSKRHETPR